MWVGGVRFGPPDGPKMEYVEKLGAGVTSPSETAQVHVPPQWRGLYSYGLSYFIHFNVVRVILVLADVPADLLRFANDGIMNAPKRYGPKPR